MLSGEESWRESLALVAQAQALQQNRNKKIENSSLHRNLQIIPQAIRPDDGEAMAAPAQRQGQFIGRAGGGVFPAVNKPGDLREGGPAGGFQGQGDGILTGRHQETVAGQGRSDSLPGVFIGGQGREEGVVEMDGGVAA